VTFRVFWEKILSAKSVNTGIKNNKADFFINKLIFSLI
jgi:hypothetical protein